MYGMFVMIEAIRQIRAAAGDDEGARGQGGQDAAARGAALFGRDGSLRTAAPRRLSGLDRAATEVGELPPHRRRGTHCRLR